MRSHKILHQRHDKILALLLALAMLCAQWAGLAHRVAHAHLLGQMTFASVSAPQCDDATHDPHHSCSLFDAATLASGVHTAAFEFAPTLNVQTLALWTAFLSWQAPFSRHFSSRAPPQA
jgi:hypothetical protein